MVAYSFQAQFADAVASGRKTQTIRANGKRRHARVGEPVQLYTGMRTKDCRKLVNPDPICADVSRIYLGKDGDIFIDGRAVGFDCAQKLAKRDGFETVDALVDWFRSVHGLPFRGVVIRWEVPA